MSTYEHKLVEVANGHGYYDAIGREADAEVAALNARLAELEALLKRKSAALEEARRALRFVCHECDVDDVRTRPACWDALARIESLEQGKTDA